ncbi:substrate-binding periplasmic protein [Chitinibacter sp. S2-10]|uniref:substrate-binding periplasmic protein n=1 Tax=Chitinibacter sp. S2-10 TaxID=3373597 RepID=UPI003977814F
MKRLFFAALLGLSINTSIQAADTQLYLMEVPPLTMNQPDRKGLVGDVVLEAFRRAGVSVQLLVEPSPRAMASVQAQDNALIIPLARLNDRENKYTWIAPITRVNRAFFTMGKRINSFDEAKTSLKTIAVSRGTAGVSILREQGFAPAQIVEVNQGETAPRMLQAGRVDAWYNLIAESRLLLKGLGTANANIVSGALLGPTEQYLACSKRCDPELVAKLAEAIKSMQTDGSLRAILSRYPEH